MTGNKLKDFLLKHEVSKDGVITHTSLFSETPAGKYNIPSTQTENFLKIYAEHVFKKGKPAYLTEKHPEKYSKVIIDIDLRYDLTDDRERKYSFDMIRDVVTNYQDAFNELLGQTLTPEEAYAYILEKPNPEVDEEKNLLKDGIHIIFPFLCISYQSQHWARRKVIEKMMEHPEFLLCNNPVNKIIDEAVVERNNFIMYGSKKPNAEQAYQLTHILDMELDECELPEEGFQLLKILSLQQRTHEKSTLVESIMQNEQKMKYNKEHEQERSILDSMNPNAFTDLIPHQPKKSKPYLKALLNLLNPSRVEDYNDWFLIGAILYNEDEENLDIWKEWSSTSKKYKESHCDKLWNKTYSCHPDDRKARIPTLQMMARNDNPNRYFIETDHFNTEDDLTNYIKKSLSCTHTEFAELAHYLLRDKYRYSNDTWYSFDRKRWRILKNPIPLLKDISLTVRGVLFRFSSMLSTKIADMEARTSMIIPEEDPLKIRKKKCEESINKLKNYTYKTAVVNESKELFYDEEFYKNLDMDIYLLGFDNGVYDLRTGVFREATPDDFVSFSTNYDYTPEIIPEIRTEIIDLFEKSLPDKGVREFMWMFLGSTLIGTNKNELFVNLEGSGGNGKGVITTMHDNALGDYAGTLDNAYLTNVSSSQEGHNSKMISVFKKRYVQVNEPPKGKTLNQDFIKELTGNDKIQIRKAHAPDPEDTQVPMFKLVMLCNKMPKIEDAQDGGFLRRYKGVNFPNRFVDREPKKDNEFRADPNLKTKLKDNIQYRQQYMIILLEYVRKYIQNDEKIPIPELVEKNTKQILRAQDYFSEFVDVWLEVTGEEAHTMTIKELIDEFKLYYNEYVGPKPPAMTQTEFTDKMNRCFSTHPVEFKANIMANGVRKGKGFVGVKISETRN